MHLNGTKRETMYLSTPYFNKLIRSNQKSTSEVTASIKSWFAERRKGRDSTSGAQLCLIMAALLLGVGGKS